MTPFFLEMVVMAMENFEACMQSDMQQRVATSP
jgi:hypothetical protein